MFDNNFSGGVGSFQNCNRPGQCHASGAIPGNNGGHNEINNDPISKSRRMTDSGFPANIDDNIPFNHLK